MIHILLILSTILHPFFVSVTDINYKQKTKTVEISSKLFFDDLEKTLEREHHESLDIVHPKDKAKINTYIQTYAQQHLKIKINNKWQTLQYIGYEISGDAAWCYFEINNIKNIKNMLISNDLLLNIHPEQTNILNVQVNGKEKNQKLNAEEKIFNWLEI